MQLRPEDVLRGEDMQDAEKAWEIYKHTMRNHPRRQLRKRELIAGYVAGVAAERARQMLFVHPNIVRAQELVSFAEHDPEGWATLVRQNPDLVRALRKFLEGDS